MEQKLLYMKIFICFSLTVFFISCQKEMKDKTYKDENSCFIVACDIDSILTSINQENYVNLRFLFDSCHYDSILFDTKVFSKFDFELKEVNLPSVHDSLSFFMEEIKSPLLIIETKNGLLKILTKSPDCINGDTIKYIIASEGTFATPYFNFKKFGKKAKISIKLKDLKISSYEGEIQLHYIFKPDSILRVKGYKELFVSSNWFSLPEPLSPIPPSKIPLRKKPKIP